MEGGEKVMGEGYRSSGKNMRRLLVVASSGR